MRTIILESQGLSRSELMQYGWLSGDHNPIHFDEKVAHDRGLPKLIVHGMFLYCIAFKAVDDFLAAKHPKFKVKDFSSKFSGMTFVGDAFRIEIEVDESKPFDDLSVRHKVFLLNKNNEPNCVFNVRLMKS